MHHTHYIEQCCHGTTVSQCRCPSPNKAVIFVECPQSCYEQGVTLDDLIQWVKANPRKKFKPYATYSKDGDFIEVYLEDSPHCTWRYFNPYVSVGYNDAGDVVAIQLCNPGMIMEQGVFQFPEPKKRKS